MRKPADIFFNGQEFFVRWDSDDKEKSVCVYLSDERGVNIYGMKNHLVQYVGFASTDIYKRFQHAMKWLEEPLCGD